MISTKEVARGAVLLGVDEDSEAGLVEAEEVGAGLFSDEAPSALASLFRSEADAVGLFGGDALVE